MAPSEISRKVASGLLVSLGTESTVRVTETLVAMVGFDCAARSARADGLRCCWIASKKGSKLLGIATGADNLAPEGGSSIAIDGALALR